MNHRNYPAVADDSKEFFRDSWMTIIQGEVAEGGMEVTWPLSDNFWPLADHCTPLERPPMTACILNGLLHQVARMRLRLWQAYLFAIAATVTTFGLRFALDGQLGGQPTLLIFTLPIMLSAYLGGLCAGLLATALSYFGAGYYLLPPLHSFAVASGGDRWQQFFVALAGVFISGLSEAFSYSISHDLRAPLRAVDGFSKAVLEDFGPQLPEDCQRYLQTIREGAQRTGNLIDDLLTFSRLNQLPLARQTVDTLQQVREVLAELKAGQSGRALEIRLGTLPACEGDPQDLEVAQRVLRQATLTNQIPVVVLTSSLGPGAVVESHRSGADRSIEKSGTTPRCKREQN